jgi:hypothetical protein
MEYLIGVLLALSVAGLASVVGFARDRAFYMTLVIVFAGLYVLFGVMGGSGQALAMELAAGSVFLVWAIVGYKTNVWLLATALAGHGVFDFVHHLLIHNPGVPPWWPGFCGSYDVVAGGCLAILLLRRSGPPPYLEAHHSEP